MLSKAKLKLIRSLELKKNRREEGLFVAEGPKVVGDLLPHFRCHTLIATSAWLAAHGREAALRGAEVCEVTDDELQRASFLRAPQQVLALFHTPVEEATSIRVDDQLILALDDIQDPGNLGTIIRLADWFGITTLVCSPGTADAFSPKVVQATMGSIARVRVTYTDLPAWLATLSKGTAVCGTFLEGTTLSETPLPSTGVIIMGNEGNGISPEVARCVNKKLFIPPYPGGTETGESLNVAVATAITCYEFRRRLNNDK